MTAPILFGIDPDETWRYIPKAVQAAGLTLPAFTLKAPSLALATKRDALLAKIRKAAREDAAEALETIYRLGKTDAAESEELAKARSAWLAAWVKAAAAHAEEDAELTARFFAECLVGWEGLSTAAGKALEFANYKGRLLEVIRGPLVEELVDAMAAGADLTQEEAVGLPSEQGSQSA